MQTFERWQAVEVSIAGDRYIGRHELYAEDGKHSVLVDLDECGEIERILVPDADIRPLPDDGKREIRLGDDDWAKVIGSLEATATRIEYTASAAKAFAGRDIAPQIANLRRIKSDIKAQLEGTDAEV